MADFAEMGVSAGLKVGGGTALVTPEPNLPEFKICNAGKACQKENAKGGRKERKHLLHLRGRGTGSAFGWVNRESGALSGRTRWVVFL